MKVDSQEHINRKGCKIVITEDSQEMRRTIDSYVNDVHVVQLHQQSKVICCNMYGAKKISG